MSLRQLVVDLITERGSGTVDDLMPRLSELGYTRKQVLNAMKEARKRGSLRCQLVRRQAYAGGQVYTEPSIHWPGTGDQMFAQLVIKRAKPKGPLVSSVFDLANPKPESAWPSTEGTVYQLLGSWGDEAASNDSRQAA